VDRRTFLKIAGAGGLSLAANCTSQPVQHLYSLVQAPEDQVTGKATWYASTCRECPAGCGILAKNREARIIKLEGNPQHPINRGALCMRGQAALQGVYNPDRLKNPVMRTEQGWRPLTFAQAEALIRSRIEKAAAARQGRLRLLTEVCGDTLLTLMTEALARWNSPPPVVFEPFAYESLRAANRHIFGLEGLPSYHLDQADVLVSFGADFLETWLSPVEYARKLKKMHGFDRVGKGLFYQVSPYQSLTCANADVWLRCRPGTELDIALAILREALRSSKGMELSRKVRATMENISAPYERDRVCELAGVPTELFDNMLFNLLKAKRPLVLGTGAGGTAGSHGMQINMAANLLNLLFDPYLTLFDFINRHRVEVAAKRSSVNAFFAELASGSVELLFLHQVNPLFTLPSSKELSGLFRTGSLFVVSFSNFLDDTSQQADLVVPVAMPLETWDEYSGKSDLVSTLQPVMGKVTDAPHVGDLLLRTAFGPERPLPNYKAYLFASLSSREKVNTHNDWLRCLQRGGLFESSREIARPFTASPSRDFGSLFPPFSVREDAGPFLYAVPSIRFFDGRDANKPWLCEVPDPLTKVAWQTPVVVNPKTLKQEKLTQGDVVRIESEWGALEAPVYSSVSVHPDVLLMAIGQGHKSFGRYAAGKGVNPIFLLPRDAEPDSAAPQFTVPLTALTATGRTMRLAHTDGSAFQHGRKIALSATIHAVSQQGEQQVTGLGMWEFPLTLPLPEGYNNKARDLYPSHEHNGYRWAMVVDLDRCIGCAACAVACYAENNIGIVGEQQLIAGREMAWLQVQRYRDPVQPEKVSFLPMLCQHCDNAPCESVCPVFAPHHSKEGLNNQIYNRCIGTRFCSQDCPYKVRRFNWFTWQWPPPLNLQLNPDVTVRSKGVMEKCSFCVQRIKEAHNRAKNEGRAIRDGEVQPACVQTCPTGVFTFGNLMDPNSEVSRKAKDKRAYQVMGYLNTKPAVIYLKKVVQEI